MRPSARPSAVWIAAAALLWTAPALRDAALACLPVRSCEATAAVPVCRAGRCADALRP